MTMIMNQHDFESKIRPLLTYVTQTAIADATGISERTIRRYMLFDSRGNDKTRAKIYNGARQIATTIKEAITDALRL